MKTRREFLDFFGRSTFALSIHSMLPRWAFADSVVPHLPTQNLPFEPLPPSPADVLSLAKGFEFKVLIRWGDTLNKRGEKFGFNNDYVALLPTANSPDDLIMWVNHESTNPLFVSGWDGKIKRTEAQVREEQESVGGSLVRIRNEKGAWTIVKNDPLNRRLSARTEIPLIAPRPIQGSKTALGTLANCAGGVTPWKTFLTCEENFDQFVGEVDLSQKTRSLRPSKLGWENFGSRPPEHYGWVVEVDPRTGSAKKLTSLGRFAHESATCTQAKDGRAVVYSGDDEADRCLYKFIAEKPGSLEAGTLYVANMESGRWIPLVREKHTTLQKLFSDSLDIMIRCREAAIAVGGSPLDRPEDIKIDPKTHAVYVALTGNPRKDRPFGSILRLDENGGDPLSMTFKTQTLIAGGTDTGVACPDNLVFDKKGHLWFTTDVSGSQIGKGKYASFGNNSLFYVPMTGSQAGRAYRVATAPRDAEFTGPCFSPDGETLFLSVQHPGEQSQSLQSLTSHWPEGGNALPRPAVVTISGPTMKRLLS